jgi:hypothetical protein
MELTQYMDKISIFGNCKMSMTSKNITVKVCIIIIFHGLGLLASNFRIYFSETYEYTWTIGGTPSRGDQPDAKPLSTQDNTTQKNVDTHLRSEWDSSTRSQFSSGRRQYVAQTARPLGPN